MEPLATLEWANAYFTHARPKSDEWNGVDDTERLRYLNWASTLIRAAFHFHENVDLENDARVLTAVCEQALWLMRRPDLYPEALTKGIASASAGVVSATFSKDFVAPLISEDVVMMLDEVADFVGKLARVRTFPLGW